MWQNLQLWHSTKKDETIELVEKAILWRTCLRQILFFSPHEPKPQSSSVGEYFSGMQAHKFLVEICSGLHSPLVGETEIFGQFRALREQEHFSAAWNPLLDAVEADAKKIRRESLIGIGSQSYGSLARSFLAKNDPVILVGGGHLAKEILPWLSDHPLFQLVRDPQKRAQEFQKVPLFSPQAPKNSTWIVAAPFKNEILLPHLKQAKTVLDFRGELSFTGELPFFYKNLESLFETLQTYREHAQDRRKLALERVNELTQLRIQSNLTNTLHRPFGWEDVFA